MNTIRLKNNKIERDSNGELLRILCMFFILIHHIISHGVFPDILDETKSLNNVESIALFINGFVFIAVNVFVLLSGYYGIKISWRSFINLFLICVFYNLIAYFVHIILEGQSIGRSILTYILFPFSTGRWWFMNCYILLYCFAPILNAAVKNIPNRLYIQILILLTFLMQYVGYLKHWSNFNEDGFTFVQFVYIYLIGRYIHTQRENILTKTNRWKYFALYIFSGCIWGCGSILSHSYDMPYWHSFYYNNIFIILGALGFFVFIMSYEFKSKFINKLATGVLAVYLIHEHYFIKNYFYSFINEYSSYILDFGKGFCFISIILLCLALLITILLFDKFRYSIMNIFWKFYDKILK